MTLLEGRKLAEKEKKNIEREVDSLEFRPKLVAVLMSDDEQSRTYVRLKNQDCREVGVESEVISIDPEKPEKHLLSRIEKLNQDESVDGILVQLPLPNHVSDNKVFRKLSAFKDVDGLNPENVGRLVQDEPRFIPATPLGVKKLLENYEISFYGKDVTIISNSDIIGKPLANLLMQNNDEANATVTVCHENTNDLKKHTKKADILITAAGKPGLITENMVNEDAVVVDVGSCKVDSGKVMGDVDFENVRRKVKAITPVPGGVGPMTVAMVVKNTVKAAKINRRR